MRKPGGVAAKWSKATDVRLFHGKSTGDRGTFSTGQRRQGAALYCTPCGERQSSHSEQERGQAAAVMLLNTGYKVQPPGK